MQLHVSLVALSVPIPFVCMGPSRTALEPSQLPCKVVHDLYAPLVPYHIHLRCHLFDIAGIALLTDLEVLKCLFERVEKVVVQDIFFD
jgi:hypothetical protein